MFHEGGSIATFKVHFHIGIINLENFVLRLHFFKLIGPRVLGYNILGHIEMPLQACRCSHANFHKIIRLDIFGLGLHYS
jgi:hypothetical protein